VKLKIRSALVRQFGRPTGLLGRLVGLIMVTCPSNLERNMRTLAQVDIQPDDRILEIGFGPGIAIERAAELAKRGKVIGVDHSEIMVRQASRRNATGIAAGRVDLRPGAVCRHLKIAGRVACFTIVSPYQPSPPNLQHSRYSGIASLPIKRARRETDPFRRRWEKRDQERLKPCKGVPFDLSNGF